MCVCAWGEGEEDRVPCEREREERDGGRSGCGTYLQNHNGAPPKQCAISIKNSNGASGKSAPLLCPEVGQSLVKHSNGALFTRCAITILDTNGALCIGAPLLYSSGAPHV